ncbi:sugar-phosphatase, partial [Escherichia coli]|nr:sugar-phosphatase [Escherichia coli]
QNVMTLGDQANDTAMIEYAGVGVAMGNAIEELKAVAQFVTTTNTEDGVARAIEKFVLNA